MLGLILASFFCSALAQISGTNPPAGSCICLNTDGVNVRSTPCGTVIGTANSGECHPYVGTKQTCSLGGTSYEYFSLSCGAGGSGQAWIAGNYLSLGSASNCQPSIPTNGDCSQVEIVSRSQWGARPPRSQAPLSTPVSAVFIHHTVTSSCTDVTSCSAQMRSIQNYHMDSNGWVDIGYNFLVGEDGRGYEGRGFTTLGTHTGNWNSYSVAICAIGNFMTARPNDAALRAIRNLINCAQQQNAVASSYSLWGHRDAMSTACPGDQLYAEIRKWPDYSCTRPSYRTALESAVIP